MTKKQRQALDIVRGMMKDRATAAKQKAWETRAVLIAREEATTAERSEYLAAHVTVLEDMRRADEDCTDVWRISNKLYVEDARQAPSQG